MTPLKVLATTDGSASAQAALEHLRDYLRPGTLDLFLLSVVPMIAARPYGFVPAGTEWAPIEVQMNQEAEAFVAAGRRILAAQGFEVVRTLVIAGDPAVLILDTASQEESDLLVVGSHGRSGLNRFVLGSVSERVATHAPCSVLVFKQPKWAIARLTGLRIVLGTDGSEGSSEAVRRLGELIDLDAAEIVVVAAYPTPETHWIPLLSPPFVSEEMCAQLKAEAEQAVEQARRILVAQGHAATTRIIAGAAGDALLAFIRDQQADLAVVGSHGRTGLSRFLLGSVSSRVVSHAECSVLVVRPP